MKKRFLILIISIIFLISWLTLLLILNYLDPVEYKIIAFSFAFITFLLSASSFFCLFLYFIKKIYFRWKVDLKHVLISFRQWSFISIFFLANIFFNYLWAPILITSSLFAMILFLLELFIKNQEA